MSKVQFNLLPDVKLQYNRAQRLRKTVNSVAFLVSAAAFGVFLLMLLTVDVVQKKQMSDAGKELDSVSKQLNSIPELNNIVTVQSQLQALTTLHQNKHVTSRVFVYLPQLTPAGVSINKLTLNLKDQTLLIGGQADSQKTVNAFVDTLKATTFKVSDQDTAARAFPSVQESNFTINPTNVNYTINMTLDPKLFANNLKDSQGQPATPKLTIPQLQNGAPGTLNTNAIFSGGQ
jgi:Tfp pilus assembly protein PilN